ncbi:MAG: hypothetical protein GEV03_21175 [Streptosporangiales bacterium]|nr:hypothetical protein [Streptosporangiales bacterium]
MPEEPRARTGRPRDEERRRDAVAHDEGAQAAASQEVEHSGGSRSSELQETEQRPAATVPADPVPTPGERPGSMLPEVHAVRADAEEGKVRRVRDVAHAPPGKPDGEVDTRP